MRVLLSWALFFSLVFNSGCNRRKEIWIYTSLPKEVIAEMVEPLQVAVPQADVKWYQSSSDNVVGRVGIEQELGKAKADLVLISDPFWYAEMKLKGRLLAYDSAAVAEVPARMKDPDHMYATVRIHALVLAYNAASFKPADLPERWKDLTQERFNNKFSMGSPLESAPAYIALAMLVKLYGWDYFAELRRRGLVAEGSNSSVLSRIETGERPIGILPLETVLHASSQHNLIKAIYPLDGIMLVPGPVAILKDTEHLEIAQKVYDWFFSPGAQNSIVKGGSYSPLLTAVSPKNAKPWSELQAQLMPWSPETAAELFSSRDRLRAKFSEVVLH